MRTLALAFANHGWSHEVATLALLASSALRIADSRSLRTVLQKWSDDGILWTSRAEMRSGLPMLTKIQTGCVRVGEGTILSELEPSAADLEYWVCSAEGGFPPYAGSMFETCEISVALSKFYGEIVCICTSHVTTVDDVTHGMHWTRGEMSA